MKTQIDGERNNDYFSLRNITPAYYEDHRLQSYLLNALPSDKNINIIDIGCGLGQTLSALKKMGYKNIKGIDVSDYAVEKAKEKGLNVKQISSIISYCESCNERFDFAIMSHVLEHIDKTEIVENLKVIRNKILNQNSQLCIMVPNAQSNTDCYWAYEDFTHTVLFTAGSLMYVLKTAGFRTITFLDVDGLEGYHIVQRIIKKVLLNIYKYNKKFWNNVTSSSYHIPSPQIFTFEIKAIAKN